MYIQVEGNNFKHDMSYVKNIIYNKRYNDMIYAYDLSLLIRLPVAWIILFSYFQWIGSFPLPKSKIKIVEIA